MKNLDKEKGKDMMEEKDLLARSKKRAKGFNLEVPLIDKEMNEQTKESILQRIGFSNLKMEWKRGK